MARPGVPLVTTLVRTSAGSQPDRASGRSPPRPDGQNDASASPRPGVGILHRDSAREPTAPMSRRRTAKVLRPSRMAACSFHPHVSESVDGRHLIDFADVAGRGPNSNEPVPSGRP